MPATLNGKSFELKYLFEAFFRDGSMIAQTPEDVSSIDSTKSAFFDVLNRSDDLICFGLVGNGHTYAVDLVDGHFEIDHVGFFAQPESANVIPIGGKFQLIYFRDHQQDFLVSGDETVFGDHRIAFRLGWKYTVDDKSWIQTIVIS